MSASDFLRDMVLEHPDTSPELAAALCGKDVELGEEDQMTAALVRNARWLPERRKP